MTSATAITQQETPGYLSEQLITCIGNKRALLPFISRGIDTARKRLGGRRLRVLDAFAGSGVVSRLLKQHAEVLVCNDLELYAELSNRCYLANRDDVDMSRLEAAWQTLHAAAPVHDGIIRRHYAPADDRAIRPGERAFYTVENAVIIDSLRTHMREAPPDLQPFLLAPLLARASVHANTAGVFKGFYKDRATGIGRFGGAQEDALTRIKRRIELPLPIFSRHACDVHVQRRDANELVRELEPVDLAYFDPPYNQHPYGSNYFMLNLIAEYTEPENLSRVSGIPGGWNRSEYNKRARAEAAFRDLVEATPARFLLVSYNNEGLIAPDTLRRILASRGRVRVFEQPYNTFRGSRNLRARQIHVRELLYLVECRDA